MTALFLPGPHAPPIPLTKVHQLHPSPRPPRVLLREMLQDFCRQGLVEAIQAGGHTYYRWAVQERRLVLSRAPAYNGGRRSKSSIDADIDWLVQHLAPLRNGSPVMLWLDQPKTQFQKKFKEPKRRLVLVCPGSMFAFPRTSAVVSILGKGSCLFRSELPNKIADLVLAGMAANLAAAFATAINRALKE